jgi:enterochelin esterase-like enzyme
LHAIALNMYTKISRYFHSTYLNRPIIIDLYQPEVIAPFPTEVLLINDGQDLEAMHLTSILDTFASRQFKVNLICVGIHASANRKHEYGTARVRDYLGRGELSSAYQHCITKEVIPYLQNSLPLYDQQYFGFLGFSLGGLSALDTVWNHPTLFQFAGIFSGALWWRDKDQYDPDFDEHQHRIMHRLIREGNHHQHLRFFFEAGRLDEKADRNNNGIIDAIDDTIDLISELRCKGYSESATYFLELPEGKHDLLTWELAIPELLQWAYSENPKKVDM